MNGRTRQRSLVAVAAALAAVGAWVAPQAVHASSTFKTYVYFDQNEEQDFYVAPNAEHGKLIQPWDPNGQMCIVPDGTGRFTVGYNPTLPGQHNPGSARQLKEPPVGIALYD